ncbi:hypothetical protein CMI47_19870 [Candidatus Pacearchaeota archaeon]|nr:hypothetical protein [Candidatus Pacearchaeota archaeon]|tara:strand:+ start:569 stop:2221 length:1653 start_codon:yes stop_codon:yes gene_type:complete
MGYLDKTSKTIDAVLTTYGRQIMARAISGQSLLHESGDAEELVPEYVITKFTLFDDEIDYSLWDENQDPNLKGRIIENMPLLEPILSNVNMDPGGGMYKYTLKDAPPVYLTDLPGGITLNGHNDNMDIIPQTNNSEEAEEYEFFLEHDNVLDMRQPWNAPKSPPTNLVASLTGDGNYKAIQLNFDIPIDFIPQDGTDRYFNVYINNQKVTNYPQSYANDNFLFPILYYANLDFGNTYELYVAARNKDGEGPPSEVVSIEVPSIPGMVSEFDISVSQGTGGGLRVMTINWNAPSISDGWMAMPGTTDDNLEGRNHYRLYLDGVRISGAGTNYGSPTFMIPFNNSNWIGDGGITLNNLGTPTGEHKFEVSTYSAPDDLESPRAFINFAIPVLPDPPTNLMLDLDHPDNHMNWFRFKWDRPTGFTPGTIGGVPGGMTTTNSGYIVYKDGQAISGLITHEYFGAPWDWDWIQPFTQGQSYDFQVAVQISMVGVQGNEVGYTGISNIGDLESEKSEVFTYIYPIDPASDEMQDLGHTMYDFIHGYEPGHTEPHDE